MSAGFSDSQSSSSSTTQNTDRRVTTDSGQVFSLQDSNLNLNGGGGIYVTSADPQVAMAAIQAVTNNSNKVSTSLSELAAGSNKIAADVAKSQEQFVATASGQKYVLWAIAAVGGILILPQFFKSK